MLVKWKEQQLKCKATSCLRPGCCGNRMTVPPLPMLEQNKHFFIWRWWCCSSNHSLCHRLRPDLTPRSTDAWNVWSYIEDNVSFKKKKLKKIIWNWNKTWTWKCFTFFQFQIYLTSNFSPIFSVSNVFLPKKISSVPTFLLQFENYCKSFFSFTFFQFKCFFI